MAIAVLQDSSGLETPRSNGDWCEISIRWGFIERPEDESGHSWLLALVCDWHAGIPFAARETGQNGLREEDEKTRFSRYHEAKALRDGFKGIVSGSVWRRGRREDENG
ncbi:hypothetical protein EG327_004886, partial [Venturia inaequalis]